MDKDLFLNKLIDLYLKYQIYRAMLESNASEHLARMVAMDNATPFSISNTNILEEA